MSNKNIPVCLGRDIFVSKNCRSYMLKLTLFIIPFNIYYFIYWNNYLYTLYMTPYKKIYYYIIGCLNHFFLFEYSYYWHCRLWKNKNICIIHTFKESVVTLVRKRNASPVPPPFRLTIKSQAPKWKNPPTDRCPWQTAFKCWSWNSEGDGENSKASPANPRRNRIAFECFGSSRVRCAS